MELNVRRLFKGGTYTIGRLFIDGAYFCDTLEDTDRGLTAGMTSEGIRAVKVPGRTAIPSGTYGVILSQKSPKFSQPKYASQYAFCGGYLPRLLNVPGFDGILIHAGNTAEHTDGCILVGRNTIKGQVTNSTATFKTLYAKLDEAVRKGERITITVR